jgi:hypothetical protein
MKPELQVIYQRVARDTASALEAPASILHDRAAPALHADILILVQIEQAQHPRIAAVHVRLPPFPFCSMLPKTPASGKRHHGRLQNAVDPHNARDHTRL